MKPVKLHRAYSLIHVKEVNEDERIIEGIATTPEPDRMGDIVEPMGVQFKNPLPLLLYHDTKRPVGEVKFSKPTEDGIGFTARIAKVDEPGTLKDRVDEAWQSIKARLIRAVSIGFTALEESYNKDTGGYRFLRSELLELSLVTIPANSAATIQVVRSIEQAASGHHTSGVSDRSPVVRAVKGARSMTIKEQITQFENTRAAKHARMQAIMQKAADEGVTLNAEEQEEYDGLEAEVSSIDGHLVRLKKFESSNIQAATPITGKNAADATAQRGGTPAPVITVKNNVPPGTMVTRAIMAIAAAKGDSYALHKDLQERWPDNPEVGLLVEGFTRAAKIDKAAVAAGTTTDATWAGPLAPVQPLVNEFLELLRPKTLLGRIPGIRRAPFNVSVPAQTAGGTYGWVGQQKPKPVTKADFSTVTLTFAKAAGIIVLTEELVRLSVPSAEETVRQEMIAGMSAFLDTQFVDPTVAAVAGVNPASVTNGASSTAASGVTNAAARADLVALINAHTAANVPLDGSVLLMSESTAFVLGTALTSLGTPLFPGLSIQGGAILGIPVIVSNNVSNRIILMHAPSILMADEGGVSIDVSREATIQMDSAPDDPTVATTVLISLWQRNLVGLRADRFITWLRARTAAVRLITGVAYNGT